MTTEAVEGKELDNHIKTIFNTGAAMALTGKPNHNLKKPEAIRFSWLKELDPGFEISYIKESISDNDGSFRMTDLILVVIDAKPVFVAGRLRAATTDEQTYGFNPEEVHVHTYCPGDWERKIDTHPNKV